MKYDVFISYSRCDYMDDNKQIIPGNIVSQVKELLDANSITYWFDEECIYSGDAFARVIAKNIRTSKILLFISTKSSNESAWTSDEIAVARAYGKKIIPFKYDDSFFNESVILYLAKLDYIDYLANPKVALSRLLLAIQEYLKVDEEREKREEEEKRRLEAEAAERAKREIVEKERRDKLVILEQRRRDINSEITTCEQSLVGLNREKELVEKEIHELLRINGGGGETKPKMFESGMGWAGLAIFLLPPLGVIALIFSFNARSCFLRGEYAEASKNSRIARILGISSLVCGALFYLIIFITIIIDDSEEPAPPKVEIYEDQTTDAEVCEEVCGECEGSIICCEE